MQDIRLPEDLRYLMFGIAMKVRARFERNGGKNDQLTGSWRTCRAFNDTCLRVGSWRNATLERKEGGSEESR